MQACALMLLLSVACQMGIAPAPFPLPVFALPP